ncbi:MAG: DnaB-like helicase N-terminal domain-containing protein [Streptosporangiaceae bacterium]
MARTYGRRTTSRPSSASWAGCCSREPADAITVANELTRRGEIARVGGGPYLHTLIASVPTAANAGYYARIVGGHAERRSWLTLAARIDQQARDPSVSLDNLHDLAAQAIGNSGSTGSRGRHLVLTPASEIKPEPVVWAWEDNDAGARRAERHVGRPGPRRHRTPPRRLHQRPGHPVTSPGSGQIPASFRRVPIPKGTVVRVRAKPRGRPQASSSRRWTAPTSSRSPRPRTACSTSSATRLGSLRPPSGSSSKSVPCCTSARAARARKSMSAPRTQTTPVHLHPRTPPGRPDRRPSP